MTTQLPIHSALAMIVEAAGSDLWVTGGSAGLMLRGLPLAASPRDLDLYCDEENGAELHHRLKAYALNIPHFSESDIYRSTLSHYDIGGWRVELVAGFQVASMGCRYKVEVRDVLLPHGKSVTVGNHHATTLVPLAHELWFNALRGRADRVETIVGGILLDRDRHMAAMKAIEERNRFPDEFVQQVHDWITTGEGGDREWTLKYTFGLQAGR
ncbi:nucleotidyltransferase family protein [Paenibacillus sp. CAU 1782]